MKINPLETHEDFQNVGPERGRCKGKRKVPNESCCLILLRESNPLN